MIVLSLMLPIPTILKSHHNILSSSECLRASADFFDMSIKNDLNRSILELTARKVQLEEELSVVNDTLRLLRSELYYEMFGEDYTDPQVRTVPPKAYQ